LKPQDKPLRVKRRLAIVGICAAVLAMAWALSQWAAFTEIFYARHVGFQLTRALSRASAILPFSLAEITLAVLGIGAATAVSLAVVKIVRGHRSVANVAANGSLRLLVAVAIVYSVFYVSWGLNYARAPLAARLGWTPPARDVDVAASMQETAEIADVARQLVDAANRAYREAMGSDDAGRPSEMPGGLAVADDALEVAYSRVAHRLGLEPSFGANRGRAKPLATSQLLSHLRLTGFYFPWTGEANYNRLPPASDQPHTVAHEKAHQRGIAREDEASFLGYLACALSDDAYVRYSGYLFAQNQVLGELRRRDLAKTRELVALRASGVKRDEEAVQAYWRQFRGAASRVSAAINNAYIRSQGDRRGTAAYAASRNLIVLFARANGGQAVVDRAGSR
jgi:hypothetical protein